ncbi:hypothetical protein [Mesorhizobium sp. CO1-1-8]|uniref:hypothetical protein n=1 Tax=Mesorhizobium sp. CO1-1-8 TaxID=2876631 RepID=UPI001CD0E728|nr:hypothetical protein [Mesorhizobium sp. CO1-1-8]MBZ9771516.1 hypothetical protein [Mesorhizobium sp. CO1-1-8]
MSIKTATPRLRIGLVDPDSQPNYKSAAIDKTGPLSDRKTGQCRSFSGRLKLRGCALASQAMRSIGKAWAATNAVDFEIQHAAADGIR